MSRILATVASSSSSDEEQIVKYCGCYNGSKP